MDTEKRIEIQKTISQGQPPMEEKPRSCEPWWESPKSNVTTYLFGTVVYAGIGAIIGAAASVLLVLAHTANPIAAIPAAIGFTAAGVAYSLRGLHKLPKIHRLMQYHHQASASQKQYPQKPEEKSGLAPIVTVVYPPDIANFPASDTYSRDKLASAKLALLTLDPAKSVRQ